MYVLRSILYYCIKQYGRGILKNILSINLIIIISSVLFSCQPNKTLKKIEFDNELFSKISLNAESKIINPVYESKYSEPYIDHSIKFTPLLRVHDWLEKNISTFGSNNKLVIDISDASIIRIEKENEDNKKYQEKFIYYYELNYELLVFLYDDDLILATTKVKSKHSTTSSKLISLNEKEIILENLIFDALVDLSSQTELLLKKHMTQYML